MSERRKATMAEARAAWDAYPKQHRSIRTVVKAMAKKDLICAIATLQRWVKADWVVRPHIKKTESLYEATVNVVEQIAAHNVVEQISAHQDQTSKLIAELRSEMQKVLADHPDDAQLARLAAREKMATQVVLARCIANNAATIVAERPGVAIGLFEILNVPITPMGTVVPLGNGDGNGNDARIIEGRVIEESPTTAAIRAFKQRERQGVAA